MTEIELLELGYRKYRGRFIDIYFKKETCIKSGNCVKGNNEVFDTSRKPWILADNATPDEVKKVIHTCPSGALKYIEKEPLDIFKVEDGRFYLEDEKGKMIAEITYSKAGEKILIIDHTFVDPVLRGQGIAAKLVERVVELAIDENKKIVPLCPYAKRLFDENEGFQQIMHK